MEVFTAENGNLAHVAVVVVTGDASDQAQAALDAGCDAVLGKPCSRTLLLATIRLLLERR